MSKGSRLCRVYQRVNCYLITRLQAFMADLTIVGMMFLRHRVLLLQDTVPIVSLWLYSKRHLEVKKNRFSAIHDLASALRCSFRSRLPLISRFLLLLTTNLASPMQYYPDRSAEIHRCWVPDVPRRSQFLSHPILGLGNHSRNASYCQLPNSGNHDPLRSGDCSQPVVTVQLPAVSHELELFLTYGMGRVVGELQPHC